MGDSIVWEFLWKKNDIKQISCVLYEQHTPDKDQLNGWKLLKLELVFV